MGAGLEVSRKALSFCCASTVFLSKPVPFLVVPLDRPEQFRLLNTQVEADIHQLPPQLRIIKDPLTGATEMVGVVTYNIRGTFVEAFELGSYPFGES
eukprot:SAG22_NODE_2497_length_2510_cov_1.882621_3_plen_97_part_00